ncbi:MAG TPA: DUF5666 domain-containing protein [Cellvibrionaceae bacterium]
MLPNSIRSGLGLLIFCALLSCGGGGGGNAGIDGSGAPAVAVVSGPINGFGSVIVNGVHYNTDNAEFWVRGVRATEAELNVGSYIHLEGTTDADGSEGVAKLIYFQPNVIGAVSNVDLLAETFVVLGQTVRLTNDTALDFAFSPRDVNGIRIGQQVEVSGPLNADGEVIATRVGLMQIATKELAGPISDLDPVAQTFRINNITVSFARTSNLPELINGQRVILRGAIVVNGVLQPNAIELEQKPQLPQGQLITQTGLITRFVSAKDFTLGNFDIVTNNMTLFERSKASDLKLNVRATIVGHLQDGKLIATKITLVADVEWKIQGPITAIRNISLAGGEIMVQGTWLKLTASTRLDSELSMAGDRMKFANLRLNDFVVVTGHQEGNNQVVTSMEREDRPKLDVEKKILGFVQKSPIKDDATSFQLEPQVTVLLEETTQFYDNTTHISKEQFTEKAAGKFVTVFGVMVDDGGFNIYRANSIQIIPSPAPGAGKGPRPGDKISTPVTPIPTPVPPFKAEPEPIPAFDGVKPVGASPVKTAFRNKPERETSGVDKPKTSKFFTVNPPADNSDQDQTSAIAPSSGEPVEDQN